MSVSVFVSVDAQKAMAELQAKADNLSQVLGFAGKEIARQMRYDFMQPTRTWSKRPEVQSIVDVRAGNLEVLAGTDDPIFTMLDRGTAPHYIFPKKPGGRLAFPWDGPGSYGAKTTPGSLKSTAGRKPTGKAIRAWVLHPGTQARGWSVIINDKWTQKGPEVLRKYLERWAKE
jgi:hypothetical protein